MTGHDAGILGHVHRNTQGRYRIDLQAGDLEKNRELIAEITESAYKAMMGE